MIVYCVNIDNPNAFSLVKKLAAHKRPNEIVTLTKEEMEVLREGVDFTTLDIPDPKREEK